MRQLCDMARACYMFRHEIDDEKMMLANKRLGLEKWNNLLWAFLVNVLGFPKAYLPGVEMASTAGPLLDIVWKGGNFGLHAERSLPASASVFSRKMHTARSRNDQAQLDVRLYARHAVIEILKAIRALQNAIIAKAEQYM